MYLLNDILRKFSVCVIMAIAMALPVAAAASTNTENSGAAINPKEIIFEHLGDGYGWEVPFNHHMRMPLPVIVWGKDGLHCFMSSKIDHGQTYTDGSATFKIAGKDSPYKGKIVEIIDGKEYKPWDFSITKNVCALFITVILVILSIMSVARWHRRMGHKAPRKFVGALESLITFIYDGVIKPTLGAKALKFAPYLLTVFFFILYMNLLGLIVVFPGGANLTGNIAVTLVLALITFFITNFMGTKHYWKEVLWPDVPMWLKFPLPIMPVIEIFGVFTKPAALTVRLFANMMGGHMIVLVLTLLIFIFGAMGAAVAGATSVVSVCFSVFMLLIDVLVSFIQAYVFTMLSTLFIAFGQEDGHAHDKHGNTPLTEIEQK
ncbi:ATP synthase F0 subunit A [Muribaculaceae bacterium Isolate-104 (HZI)]|nr:ATP synthase F0 subunit A [Muribaculaceae bacterium Isolate-104 (HZI)]